MAVDAMAHEIPWRQLIEVTKKQRHNGETTSELEWKDRVVDQVMQEGWKAPGSKRIYQAIDAVKAAARKRPAPPLARGTYKTDFTRVSNLSPRPPENACGCLKPLSGRKALRCMLPAGHDGDHGLLANGQLFVRWGR